MSDLAIITFALIAAVAGIAYGLYLAMWVFKLNAGNAKMQEISKAIQEGAGAYMNRQYRTVGVVAAVLFVLLAGAALVTVAAERYHLRSHPRPPTETPALGNPSSVNPVLIWFSAGPCVFDLLVSE